MGIVKRRMFSGVYAGRRVLVTGHTGFKGSWLCSWLLELGAEVAGYSLDVPTQPSNFEALGLKARIRHFNGDIRDRDALAKAFAEFRPEMVFHLAAQSLVRRSFDDPAYTFTTNAIGTMQVLECLRSCSSVRAGVLITSDKCYQNAEWAWGYRENDRLGGDDPYSASKACAELIAAAYMHSCFREGWPKIATVRAGNVIGGGDWAADRILPDCIRAWSAGEPVKIRNPGSTRPWQHVLEPLSGYLWLGANLWLESRPVWNESFNFGPEAMVNQSVEALIARMATYWEGALWGTDKNACGEKREKALLKLSCDKALHYLDWHAVLSFDETVRLVCEWYQSFYNHEAMQEITKGQIKGYAAKAAEQGLPWAA